MLGLFKGRTRDPRAELQDLLGRYEVPSVSSTVISVLSLLRDPDASMSEVASRVETDPGLTVRILRLTNSAAFGLLSQVSNLQHAIALMGRSRLESLVLTFAAVDRVPIRMECMETSLFWAAAARRATLARSFAQHMHAATQAEAFTAGLLQDIAVPLLAAKDPEGYAAILERWHADHALRLDVLERELFGFDHAIVGALMAEDWGLPEYLVQAIGGHHGQAGNSGADPAVRLVSLVKYSPENDGTEAVREAAETEFKIEAALIQEMVDRSFADAGQFAGMFSN
jgi:HD-like signal output (HDOD) protein